MVQQFTKYFVYLKSSHFVVSSIVLPTSEVLPTLNGYLVEVDLPQVSHQDGYSVSIRLNNDVVLTLSLDNLEMSYEKDRWISIFTPTDQRRLYLHVKYLYLSKKSKGNLSFFQTFRDYQVNSDNYLYLYPNDLINLASPSFNTSPYISELSPSPPITPRATIFPSSSSTSSTTNTISVVSPASFTSYYVASFLSIFLCWCVNIGVLPQLFRFIFSTVIFSAILIVYPNE